MKFASGIQKIGYVASGYAEAMDGKDFGYHSQ